MNEEGEEGEGEYPEEIAEENDDQGDWLLNVSSIIYLMEIDVSFVSKLGTLLCCIMIFIFAIWDAVYCSLYGIEVLSTIMADINLLYFISKIRVVNVFLFMGETRRKIVMEKFYLICN